MISRRPSIKRLLATTALAVVGLAGSAHAAYQVRVSAESVGQLDYGRGYNAGTYRSGAPGGPGYSSYGGVCTPGAFLTCSAGGSGTMDSNPNLTAATESTSVDSTSLPSGFYPQGLHVAASSYATANLASGTVGIADSGTYGLSGCCSGQDGGLGSSYAENSDVLHFAVGGASPGTMTIIGVSFRVHGGMDAFTPQGDSSGGMSAVFQLGGGNFQGFEYSSVSSGYTPVFSEAGQTGGWLTDYVTQDAPGEFTFNATYGLTGAAEDLGINEYLQEVCSFGTACDYAHTGAVSFTLPSNVTFTSDSGVFLTQGEIGVPEPATWTLMIAGAGLMGAAARRRRMALSVI